VLRSHHLVAENRQGRNVFYHLRNAKLARWIMDGTGFILPDASEMQRMMTAVESVRDVWGAETKPKRAVTVKKKVTKAK
jgi:hypothetical protein